MTTYARLSSTATGSVLFALAVTLVLCVAACADSEAEPETDSSLCTRFCKQLPDVCPRFVEGSEDDCHASCVTAEDSSTEFRRCMADATSCDALVVCKNSY